MYEVSETVSAIAGDISTIESCPNCRTPNFVFRLSLKCKTSMHDRHWAWHLNIELGWA